MDAPAVPTDTAAFPHLRSAIDRAWVAERYDLVRKQAEQYLALADAHKDHWNYGNALHHGNLYLGLLAHREGDLDRAQDYLLRSAATPGSPQLNSFGPNTLLADRLLAAGRREAARQFLERCRAFWSPQLAQIDSWLEALDRGEHPDFERNFLY